MKNKKERKMAEDDMEGAFVVAGALVGLVVLVVVGILIHYFLRAQSKKHVEAKEAASKSELTLK